MPTPCLFERELLFKNGHSFKEEVCFLCIYILSFSSFNVFHLFLCLLIYLSEGGQNWQNYFGTVANLLMAGMQKKSLEHLRRHLCQVLFPIIRLLAKEYFWPTLLLGVALHMDIPNNICPLQMELSGVNDPI